MLEQVEYYPMQFGGEFSGAEPTAVEGSELLGDFWNS